MRYRTLHYYAEGALKGLRTDTLGNVTPASYALLLGSFSFGSMSCLVEKRAANAHCHCFSVIVSRRTD